ncbi:MAG: proton-conducting transporter membrane subunit [Ignavibacteriales bacterium]|nr:proton-conducting transporter membrane subunit [Ignavibacteriales bacterium]
MISILLFLPIVLGVLVLLANNRLVTRASLLLVPAVYLSIVIALWNGISWIILPGWLTIYFGFDSIGTFFLTIMSVVFAMSSVYSLFYFKEHKLSKQKEAAYTATIFLFVTSMTGVLLATHLALLWVFVEATTLSSALLIYFERKKSSLEAAWKYVYICSIGIALAFIGIIILSIGSRSFGSLFFVDLYKHAAEINPFWLQIAFAFIFIGFGTKIGIAPIHAWLPDAHSEAPSPVSALLSGTLLNTAFLGLIRVQEIMIRADKDYFSNFLLLVSGFLSLFISAVFMLQIKNYKRMLAYSSIENMGILFIGVALGAPGIFAAMIHLVAHSFSKASLFLTSGNILNLYKSKKVDDVQGLIKKDSFTGWIWIASFLSISGMPPFPSFISKFLIIKAFFMIGMGWLAVPFFILLAVIMYGMGGTVFKMSFGNDLSNEPTKRLDLTAYVGQVILLLLLLTIGTNIPQSVLTLIQNAAGFLN